MKNTEIKSTAQCLIGDQKYTFYITVNFSLKTFLFYNY